MDVLRVQSVLGAKLKPGVYFNFMAPHHTFILKLWTLFSPFVVTGFGLVNKSVFLSLPHQSVVTSVPLC